MQEGGSIEPRTQNGGKEYTSCKLENK
jgi:putative hemolysin